MNKKQFYLYDQAWGGGLAEQLRVWREEGCSYDEIVFRLRDHHITVSRATVHRWTVELGLPLLPAKYTRAELAERDAAAIAREAERVAWFKSDEIQLHRKPDPPEDDREEPVESGMDRELRLSREAG